MKIYNNNIDMEIDIIELLKKHQIKITIEKIVEIYNNSGRVYHNFNHIVNMLKNIKVYSEELIIAILFHDIVYKYDSKCNEIDSYNFFIENYDGNDKEFKENIKKAILATGLPLNEILGELEKEMVRLDRLILYSTDLGELLEWEEGIFKEYQVYKVNIYKEKRIEFLEKAYEETKNEKLIILKEIVRSKKYKIGFYPGSFNPFHIGHYNILLKAEKIFDKVIIGVGVNYEKLKNERYEIPKKLSNREIIEYSGLITTAIEELQEEGEIFVVRGLRNEYDLQYEENLRNSIKDFLPKQYFAYFFCDKEYEHISSSLIRDIRSREDRNIADFIKKYCLE